MSHTTMPTRFSVATALRATALSNALYRERVYRQSVTVYRLAPGINVASDMTDEQIYRRTQIAIWENTKK